MAMTIAEPRLSYEHFWTFWLCIVHEVENYKIKSEEGIHIFIGQPNMDFWKQMHMKLIDKEMH